MCGICGWVNPSGLDLQEVVQMNRRAAHRGPDGEGYWWWDGSPDTGHFVPSHQADALRQQATVGLGHRRLAILDLSDAGLQPMPSPDRHLWAVFNGEIYNYLELRAELQRHGYVFRTGTDTEVILAAYQHWGTDCFARFNGMWGLALVDVRKRMLVLSRDRLGIKPLYVWTGRGGLAFASEIKQFFALSKLHPRANTDALIEFISTGYELPPATFFDGIQAFEPGTWTTISLDRPTLGTPQAFWFPDHLTVRPSSQAEAEERTRLLFEDAVRLRLRSDVPVGVCLSGGLDSSAIYGQMQRLKDGAADATLAFSAAYDDEDFDEQPFVDMVLRDFGGQGRSTHTTAEDFLEDSHRFVYQHDEPPGSLSPYAAWATMRLARQHEVPVLLNGQGGDELFSGYWPAYYLFLRRMLLRAPWQIVRHAVGALMPGGNAELVTQVVPHLRRYVHRKKRHSEALLAACRQAPDDQPPWAVQAQQLTPPQYRLHEIRNVHLPRLLKWDDRNAMAFSIEGRYPFLDHRLVEWAMQIPPRMNFDRGWNKVLIRKALGHLLPPAIQWRRSKIGFVTPQSDWIRTTLRPGLQAWVASPSEPLKALVDRNRLATLAETLFSARHIHPMDERQVLLIRLFLLDLWFKVFQVDLREPLVASEA